MTYSERSSPARAAPHPPEMSVKVDEDYIRLFVKLFRGNRRSFGQFDPKDHSMWVDKGRYEKVHVEKHLSGEVGLGVVPVTDDGTCHWAAIDVDAHGEGESIDLIELERRIKDQDLPLTVCRSKSAGAHCYIFFVEAEPAADVIRVLKSWAAVLGYAGSEVFPKQAELHPGEDGVRPYGNWINLPYFGMDDTNRYAIEGGKKVSFEYFLQLADSNRVRLKDLEERAHKEHPDAPPCFQKMLLGIPARGARNNAIYNATLYYKKIDPDNVRQRVVEFNAKCLAHPLSDDEVSKTVRSASRRDYSYKCFEEPVVSLCDRDICVTRKYGISPYDKSKSLPRFSNLRKYDTNPVYWEIDVDGKSIICPTKTLINWWLFREQVFEVTLCPPPDLKKKEWDVILNKLTNEVTVIRPPEDASTQGILIEMLMEFLQKANLDGEDEDRRRLFRGIPVVTTHTEAEMDPVRFVVFRMRDFVSYLKKNRFEEFKGSKLYVALKGCGLESIKMKAGGTVISVWGMPISKFKQTIQPMATDLEY